VSGVIGGGGMTEGTGVGDGVGAGDAGAPPLRGAARGVALDVRAVALEHELARVAVVGDRVPVLAEPVAVVCGARSRRGNRQARERLS
jgi:hypothetical protein